MKYQETGIKFFPVIGVLPFQRFRKIKEINVALNTYFLRLYLKLRYFDNQPIYWSFNQNMATLWPYLGQRKIVIYDRVDNSRVDDPILDKEIQRLDKLLIRKADLVFTNSEYSLRAIKRYNKDAYLVPCGYAPELFCINKSKIPKEMMKIRSPRLGLIGNIDQRIDLELLSNLAKKHSEWNIVLVGPVSISGVRDSKEKIFFRKIKKLRTYHNVHFLGRKPKSTMANYVKSFDICLIPYRTDDEFVKGCNPMKLYEYLAMGKPVISSQIEAIEKWKPAVRIAKNPQMFERNIRQALASKIPKQEVSARKQIAIDNSWETKVKEMWNLLKIKSLVDQNYE